MSEEVGFSKRYRLVDDLTARIRSGRLARGERLPGENDLAQEYRVSRGTVRGALSELQRLELIRTETGVGSFVTFSGGGPEPVVGWAHALAEPDSTGTTELLSIAEVADPALSARFELPRLFAVRRRCRDESGRPIALEHAVIPGDGKLSALPVSGLVGDSLTATLRAAGLHPVRGEQWIRTETLGAADAELMERPPGELFFHTTRTTFDASSRLVEHVISLIDPGRFQFHLAFGGEK